MTERSERQCRCAQRRHRPPTITVSPCLTCATLARHPLRAEICLVPEQPPPRMSHARTGPAGAVALLLSRRDFRGLCARHPWLRPAVALMASLRRVDLLRGCALFDGLPDEELRAIAPMMKLVNVRAARRAGGATARAARTRAINLRRSPPLRRPCAS